MPSGLIGLTKIQWVWVLMAYGNCQTCTESGTTLWVTLHQLLICMHSIHCIITWIHGHIEDIFTVPFYLLHKVKNSCDKICNEQPRNYIYVQWDVRSGDFVRVIQGKLIKSQEEELLLFWPLVRISRQWTMTAE